MTEPTIQELIARSSLGGAAWCARCKHADMNHDNQGCIGGGDCPCTEFTPMSPEEWLRWRRIYATEEDM